MREFDMNHKEIHEKEVATIKPRKFMLDLSDADVEALFDKAGKVGMTGEKLLQNFVGDLVCGTYTNGSDERMLASQWFDRCGFSYMRRKSYLVYLIDTIELDEVMELLEAIDDAKEQIDYFKHIKDFDNPDGEDSKEELTFFTERLKETQDELDSHFNKYKVWAENDAQSFDVEMMAVTQWVKHKAEMIKGDVSHE